MATLIAGPCMLLQGDSILLGLSGSHSKNEGPLLMLRPVLRIRGLETCHSMLLLPIRGALISRLVAVSRRCSQLSAWHEYDCALLRRPNAVSFSNGAALSLDTNSQQSQNI
eukprot:6181652-Pleurochrysis_carterae.AAC.3